ncbi:MAG: NAD-dependent epimerase/dehydratase family protein [Eubacterium sp.]|jgi:UDP-glucose 4-epimerase|nr:NAD-dependent epimerase/dehydratase family protein [Eubacterium sp.]
MNILVAGGAGFIGSHLIDKFIGQGHNIICADRLIMGSHCIKHLSDEKLFQFYNINLADQEVTNQLFQKNRIDAVYHLAANSDIQKGGKEPDIDFKDTLLTTRNLLEGMRKTNVKKIFFASTSAVYGEMQGIKLTETTGGLMPVSYYGGAKLASEALIFSYAFMADISAVIFRFPNVVGPRLTHGVIFDFIKKLQDNPHVLEILGDGTQCKPYIYVSDLAEAVMQMTARWPEGAQIYNLSINGGGTTVTRIAEIIVEEMGLHETVFHYTGGRYGWKGDVPEFEYDISRILSEGWMPEYTSEEAVRQCVKDMLGRVRTGRSANLEWEGDIGVSK